MPKRQKKVSLSDDPLTCKPINSYQDISVFLANPPPWRSLCKELTPHSTYKIINKNINNQTESNLDEPETFCHFSPDKEDPLRCDGKTLPKTLVCHDLANGYHDDSHIDGTTHHDVYTFYNWAGIDIFCYFSHHFITIPPLSWINIGHAHGVKVIGTVITEWSEGMELWDKILISTSEYRNFASQLVAIAKTLKFDGWLLNIEAKVNKPDVLLEFVRYLHFLLHQEIPHAELIWYDSVTIDGHLNWQNALNDKNKAFFAACDGIFTNYSWNEIDVTSSCIVADDADRLTDLYIGIDVWGRNFYGGGQFNTQEAIQLVHDHGCSLAIFAPGWTYEAMTLDKEDPNTVVMADQLDPYEQFLLRDRALWGSFWPYLHTHLPCTLPFKTSFCRGQGLKRRSYGEVICPSPWFNLRHQQYQPNSSHGPHGYLLSTADVIMAVSKHGYVEDHKGIIRYRKSFIRCRQKSAESAQDIAQAAALDAARHNALDAARDAAEDAARVKAKDAAQDTDDNPAHASRDSQEHLRSKRHKVADAIKHFFHIKSDSEHSGVAATAATASTAPTVPTAPTADQAAEDPAAGPSSVGTRQGTGKSLVATSVKLLLGQSSAKHHRIGLACVPHESECLEVYHRDSFTGGTCLRVHPVDSVSFEHRLTRLFHCDFRCESALLVCVATKTLREATDQYLNVKLYMQSHGGLATKVVLVGRRLPHDSATVHPVPGGVCTTSPMDMEEHRFKELQKYLLVNEPGFYVPVENAFGWSVRYYEVFFPGSKVTSINVRTGLTQGAVLLGYFGMCHVKGQDA